MFYIYCHNCEEEIKKIYIYLYMCNKRLQHTVMDQKQQQLLDNFSTDKHGQTKRRYIMAKQIS